MIGKRPTAPRSRRLTLAGRRSSNGRSGFFVFLKSTRFSLLVPELVS